jgi:hypothetical protein
MLRGEWMTLTIVAKEKLRRSQATIGGARFTFQHVHEVEGFAELKSDLRIDEVVPYASD